MRSMKMRFIFDAVFAGVLVVYGGASDACRGEELTPAPPTNPAALVVEKVGIQPRLGEQLPLDAEFVDHTGKKVRLGDCVKDRPVILHLVYHDCPMLCRLSSDGLLSTLPTVSLTPGEDFSVITLSFDATEGPELSARARKMAAARCGEEAVENGWSFLTGDEANIKKVTEAVGFGFTYDEATKQYAHSAGIFIATPEGKISRYLGGIHYPPRDVKFAVVEASDGRVGSAIDQAMLLCYMYDPTVGKYGLAVLKVMRISGVLTVVTMAAAIFTMVRRERRRNDSQSPPDAISRALATDSSASNDDSSGMK